jgi:hypothetical protein
VSRKNIYLAAFALTVLIPATPALAQYSNSTQDVVTPIPQIQTAEEGQRRLELTAGGQNLTAG